MKKLIVIAAVLAGLPFAASAQNKAIEQLASRYTDREGYTVVALKGEMVKYIGSAVDVSTVNIADLMEDISSIVVITGEKADPQFRKDVQQAISTVEYTTLMSVSDGGQYIRFLLAPVGGTKKNEPKRNEFVMVVLGQDENVLISIVGKYKVKQITKSDERDKNEKQEEDAK